MGKHGHTFGHNVPTTPHSATLTPEYQVEVDRTLDRARQRWEHQQTQVAKAERRRARVAARKPRTAREAKVKKRRLAELDALIELERQHLQRIHGLMRQTPRPSANRGSKSYRPVPDQAELI